MEVAFRDRVASGAVLPSAPAIHFGSLLASRHYSRDEHGLTQLRGRLFNRSDREVVLFIVSRMRRTSHLVRAVFFMLMAGAADSTVAQTTQGSFTGGDPRDGLDLQGNIVLAYHMGGATFPIDVGQAQFKPDSNLTLTGADEVINDWAALDFGPTADDANLTEVMRAIRHNGREHGTMTLTRDRSLVVGDTYKVQLLFVESGPAQRRFDIAVGGNTVLPAFTLPAATDPPVARVVTHTFVATDRDFVVTLDGAGIPDEAGVDTNPILSALTLERCTPFTAVVTNDHDSGSGSLRQAIADASGCPATITFAPALNGQIITLTSGQLEITGIGPTILDASGLISGLWIFGNNTSRVFRTGPGTQVRLINLSLLRGNGLPASGGQQIGGGLLNEGTVILDRCELFQNIHAGLTRGGGVYNRGTATLTECTIYSHNIVTPSISDGGGGIFNDAAGHLTLTGCTLRNNQAPSGGGLMNNGTAVLTGCTFFSNQAGTGGALTSHGTITLTSCSVDGNFASLYGGGLSNHGNASLIECTLTRNGVLAAQSAFGGGGIVHGPDFNPAAFTLSHCLIAGNTVPPGAPGPDMITETPLTASWCLIGNGLNAGIAHGTNGNKVGGGGQPIIPAGLAPLEFIGGPTLTALPLPGSAAIDAGNPATFPASSYTDQRGGKRRRGSRQDIGAVETMPDLSSVRITLFRPSGGIQNFQVVVPVDVGPLVTQTSTDLSNWTTAVLTGTATPGLFTVPFNAPENKRFYRVTESP